MSWEVCATLEWETGNVICEFQHSCGLEIHVLNEIKTQETFVSLNQLGSIPNVEVSIYP